MPWVIQGALKPVYTHLPISAIHLNGLEGQGSPPRFVEEIHPPQNICDLQRLSAVKVDAFASHDDFWNPVSHDPVGVP